MKRWTYFSSQRTHSWRTSVSGTVLHLPLQTASSASAYFAARSGRLWIGWVPWLASFQAWNSAPGQRATAAWAARLYDVAPGAVVRYRPLNEISIFLPAAVAAAYIASARSRSSPWRSAVSHWIR